MNGVRLLRIWRRAVRLVWDLIPTDPKAAAKILFVAVETLAELERDMLAASRRADAFDRASRAENERRQARAAKLTRAK